MSKKIGRYIATGLILAMSLTGCGAVDSIRDITNTQGTSKEVVKLRVWGGTEDQGLLNQLVEGFKQEYSSEASFEIIVEEQNEATCKDTILENVNDIADVFTFIDDQLMTLAASGVLEPIEYQEEVRSSNLEGAVDAATINEQLYAYPLTADNGYFMYYNKDYFNDEDVKSLNRMLEIAAQNNKKIAMDWTSGWYLYSFFGNTGLEVGINPDYITNYCTWNATTGDIKGTDVAQAMHKIATNNGFANITNEEFVSGAKDGSIIAGVGGVWNALAMEEIWKEGYGATKLPTYTVAGKEVQMASYAGYKMMGVNAYSDNLEWAEKLAKYISNEQSQIERFKQRGQGPSNSAAANSKEVSESIAIKALIEQSEFSSLQRVGEMYWNPSSQLGQILASGDLQGRTYQQLLDDAVAEIIQGIETK